MYGPKKKDSDINVGTTGTRYTIGTDFKTDKKY